MEANKIKSQETDNPKVFISYSHDSQEHMIQVLNLSNRLRTDGIDCTIDQYVFSPPEGWPRWMANQIEEADFVLVVCTESYERRFKGKEETGKGLGAKWEGAIITQELYDAEAKNTNFIPVIFSEKESVHIPIVLRGATYYKLNTEEGYEALYRHLTNQPRVSSLNLGNYDQCHHSSASRISSIPFGMCRIRAIRSLQVARRSLNNYVKCLQRARLRRCPSLRLYAVLAVSERHRLLSNMHIGTEINMILFCGQKGIQ